jgi:hypothetical protein
MRQLSSFGRMALSVLVLTLLAAGASHAAEVRPDNTRLARGKRPEVMSGDFSGVVTTMFLDKQLVQSWLPSGLIVAPETPFPQHPVIVMFGIEENITRTKRITAHPRYAQHYLETFVAVPYLKLASRPDGAPLVHFPRVYLNSWRATTQGVKRFGWPKVYTELESGDGTYRIGGGQGTIFDAETERQDVPLVAAKNPSLRTIQQMLSQPLVLKHDGSFHVYNFDWHFDAAACRATSADVEINAGFLPGLEPRNLSVRSIADEAYGAFYLESHFTKTLVAY